MKYKVITVTLNPCVDKTIEVESFCEGGLNRAGTVRADAGGKGINVAKVLKNFGVNVLATGIIGEEQSEIVINELDKRGIAHDFLVVPGITRTNYKVIDLQKKQMTEINEPGFSVSEEDVSRWKEKLKKCLTEAEILVLSGSVAKGVSSYIYRELIETAKQYNVKVILDADGERLRAGLEKVPFAIKPNQFELEQLYNKRVESEEEMKQMVQKLLQQGVGLVVVSSGENGAVFGMGEEIFSAKPPVIDSKSTVGAGDSMVAAIAYSLMKKLPLSEMARLATAAGTVTAGRAGTEVCTLESVLEFAGKTDLKKLY